MSTTASASLVPFGARVEHTPHLVRVAPGELSYDAARQMNLDAAGQPSCTRPGLLASSTGTNWDSQPDETADPGMIG